MEFSVEGSNEGTRIGRSNESCWPTEGVYFGYGVGEFKADAGDYQTTRGRLVSGAEGNRGMNWARGDDSRELLRRETGGHGPLACLG